MNALRIACDDSVAVVVQEIAAGEPVVLTGEQDSGVVTREKIPFGHKVALVPIAQDESVIKYGHPIGRATDDILPGAHVHTHNLVSVRGAANR